MLCHFDQGGVEGEGDALLDNQKLIGMEKETSPRLFGVSILKTRADIIPNNDLMYFFGHCSIGTLLLASCTSF